MIHYILHVSLLLGLGFVLYQVLLRKETFYQLNRYILSSFLLLAFTLPLLHIPQSWSLQTITPLATAQSSVAKKETVRNKNQAHPNKIASEPKTPITETSGNRKQGNEAITAIPQIPKEANSTSSNPTHQSGTSINWSLALLWVYFMGLGIFLINFLVQFSILLYYRYKYPVLKDGKLTIVEMEGDKAPFSFLHMIYINPSKYDYDTYEQILAHEKIHINRWHSFDIFLSELTLIVQWFNPFAWYYRKAVEHNLEYLTDQEMLASGANAEIYQMNLLKVSVPEFPLALSTNYNQSFLKKRIQMMNAKKSSASSTWKYLFILPILGLSVALFNPTFITAQPTEASSANLQSDTREEPPYERTSEIMEPTAESNQMVNQVDEVIRTQSSAAPAEMRADIEALRNKLDQSYKSIQDHSTHATLDNTSKSISIDPLASLENQGKWEGNLEGSKVCLRLKNKEMNEDFTWITSRCFPKSDFKPKVAANTSGTFTLEYDAGTLVLDGQFGQTDGSGNYSFTADLDYIAAAKKEGYTISEDNLIQFFLVNMDRSFFKFLQTAGYQDVDEGELITMAMHDVDQDFISTFNREFKTTSDAPLEVDELITLKVHNVDINYVQSLVKTLDGDLEVDEVVTASIHNVEPSYIQKFKSAGFDDLDFDDLIAASIHNVNPSYITAFQQAGIEMDFDDLITASIHNIKPDYIQAFQQAGMELDFDDLVAASIHNVDVHYIKSFQNAGIEDIEFDDIIAASIHNVDPNYIKGAQDYGFDLNFDQMIQASIHNVDLKYLEAFQNAGFEDLDFDDIVSASIHNIDPKFIKEFNALGHEDLTFDDLVTASIHNVSVDYIKSFKKAGFDDIDFDDYVTASIHGVSTRYIQDAKDAGLDELEFDDLIAFNIHGVNLAHVKNFKAMGFDLSPDDIIAASIHGLTPAEIKKIKAKGHNSKDFEKYLELKMQGY